MQTKGKRVYEAYEGDELVAVGSAGDIIRQLKLPSNYPISNFAETEYKMLGRYTVMLVGSEWKNTYLQIRKKLGEMNEEGKNDRLKRKLRIPQRYALLQFVDEGENVTGYQRIAKEKRKIMSATVYESDNVRYPRLRNDTRTN